MAKHLHEDLTRLTILEINVGGTQLTVFEDGTALTVNGADSVILPRQVGRYLLRRFYEIRTRRSLKDFSLQEIGLDNTCKRADCNSKIPRDRLLNALDRHSPAKYCRTTCQCTEATRRYRFRKFDRVLG